MHLGNRFADFLSRSVVFLLIASVGAAVFVWYLPLIQQNQRLRERINLEKLEIDRLRTTLSEVQTEIEHYNTNNIVLERLARERFKYARPGETVFIFVPPGHSGLDASR